MNIIWLLIFDDFFLLKPLYPIKLIQIISVLQRTGTNKNILSLYPGGLIEKCQILTHLILN